MSVFVALKYIGNVFPASAMKKDYSKFLMCEWCLRELIPHSIKFKYSSARDLSCASRDFDCTKH